MPKKKSKPEQIVALPRQIEVQTASGNTVSNANNPRVENLAKVLS
jgi:hypothetical protein